MKVVLQKEVQGLGRAGEVKNVSDGYAQNFLFPKKMAVVANERNIDIVTKQAKKKRQAKKKSRK